MNSGLIALVIPSYNPDARLIELLQSLFARWDGPVIVVDDGSGPESARFFSLCRDLGATVVAHEQNRGKGEALKTGFAFAASLTPRPVGVVCADDDCRHLPKDVLAVGRALVAEPSSLVLGCRDFSAPEIPPLTHFANLCTRLAVHLFCGVRVSDTQSGLRGLPMDFAVHMCDEEAAGFEFEAAMLAEAERSGIPFSKVGIAYVNDPGAPLSEFRPVVDTVRILAVMVELFAKYALSSVFCYALDFVLFALLMRLLGASLGVAAITASTVIARIISAGTNFAVNRRKVFGAGVSARRIARYVVLSAGIMVASAVAVGWLAPATGVSAVVVKPLVDFALFFVNYKAQQLWVFA